MTNDNPTPSVGAVWPRDQHSDDAAADRGGDAPRAVTAYDRPQNRRGSCSPYVVVIGPGDSLSAKQTLRLAEAVAVLSAKRALLASGVTPDELQAYEWVVEVTETHSPSSR